MGLIVVNCNPVKISMAHHINNCRDAILGHVELRQMEANMRVIRLFEEQAEPIMREAQSTEECLQLAKEIASAQVQLDELKGVLEQSRQADRFLEEHWYVPCCLSKLKDWSLRPVIDTVLSMHVYNRTS
jgi:hypothetical protein